MDGFVDWILNQDEEEDHEIKDEINAELEAL